MSTEIQNSISLYRVDDNDMIVFLNDGFRKFAVNNDAAPLADCVGRSLWDFIEDWDTKELYRLVLNRVRSGNIAVCFPFRCDAPDRRRFMEMEIEGVGDGLIEFRCRVEREESRTPLGPSSVQSRRADEFITMCSWCKRIRGDALNWLEVEDAVAEFATFECDSPAKITHGICSSCFEQVVDSMQ